MSHTGLENLNFPMSRSGEASSFVVAKGAGCAVFSPHHASVQLLNSYRTARKQINKQLWESQEEEGDQDHTNVPKYNKKKSFPTLRPFHPLYKGNKVDKDMLISISIIIHVRIVLREG